MENRMRQMTLMHCYLFTHDKGWLYSYSFEDEELSWRPLTEELANPRTNRQIQTRKNDKIRHTRYE